MPCVSFKEMTEKAAAAALALFCYEGGGTRPLKEALRSFKGKTGDAEISVVVGPEGGFSPEEAESAKKAGFIMSGLGKRILRCETAPLYALSCIAYELESPGTSEDKS